MRLTRIEPKCHKYLYYFGCGVQCIECGSSIKYIFHVCKKYRKSSCTTWTRVRDKKKEKRHRSVMIRNWRVYCSRGQLYEYTSEIERKSGDIKYSDEWYTKSSKVGIDIDTIINTYVPRKLTEDLTIWNPTIN